MNDRVANQYESHIRTLYALIATLRAQVARRENGGGGVCIGLRFTTDTGSTADSDPGAGLMKWNHATQSSATVIYFDDQTADAISLTTFFSSIPAAGYLYLQQSDDEEKWQIWLWSAVADGTGYRKFTATLQAYGGAIADDKTVLCDFIPKGLTNFTEAANSSSPNASRPVVSLVPNNAASTVDIAFVPKGSDGGLSLAVPDGTSVGGNKRGPKAVDLQMNRNAASQVASGTRSALLGGTFNTASGQDSAVIAGSGNVTSAQEAVAIGGSSNVISGQASVGIGGYHTLSGANSVAVCKQGRDLGVGGSFAIGNNNGAHQGNETFLVLDGFAIGTTLKTLTSNNSTPGAANQVILSNASSVYIEGTCVARRFGNTDSKSWTFKAQAERSANAASTRIVGSSVTVEFNDAGAAGWTLALTVNTTIGGVNINFTGDNAGHFYQVTARCQVTRMQGN